MVAAIIFTTALINDRLLGELASQADTRRRLLARVLDAETQRRRLLAQDLHDRTLQTLLAARQDLEEAGDGSTEALSLARRQVDDATHALQDALHGLHGASLTGSNLGALLHALAHRMRAESEIVVELRLLREDVGPYTELLYAVAREALTAVVHHRHATRAILTLRDEGRAGLVLEVQADGDRRPAGDLLGDVPAGRSGLEAFAERVAEAGGELLVDAAPGAGTSVLVRLPLAPSALAPGPS